MLRSRRGVSPPPNCAASPPSALARPPPPQRPHASPPGPDQPHARRSKVYTLAELERHNTASSLKVAVRGKVYDLTSFLSRHPGGRIMLLLAAGRDATALFESYHPNTAKVEPLLAKYEVGAFQAPPLHQAGDPSAPDSRSDPLLQRLPQYGRDDIATPFYVDLKRRVHSYIATESRYCQQWHDGPTQALRLAAIVALIVGFMYASLWAPSAAAAVAFAALAGVSRALSGVHVLHDASHGSLGKDPRWWHVLGVVGNDVINGTSFYMWQHQHLLVHHLYCNVPGVDDDMDSEPMLRFHEGQQLRWFHRFQALYAVPLYGAMGLVTRARDVACFLSGFKGACRLRPPRAVDRLAFWGGKAAFLAMQLGVPLALGFSPARVALQFVAADWLGGMYLASCFQCSHVADGVATGKHVGGKWAEEQVATTQDYGHGSLLTYLMTGGLNYQVVHHLLPGVSQFHYPSIQPIIAKCCADHGVPYRCLPGAGDAIMSHLRHLHKMGNPQRATAAKAA